jgi:hypothetical protein
MKALSKITRRSAFLAVATTLVLMFSALSAFATPAQQVARVLTIRTITAQCCVSIGPSVQITEPTAVTPVIVTFSTDYADSGTVLLGLSVNHAPCAFYGSGVAPLLKLDPTSASIFESATFQWVVMKTELVKGLNTFEVCGGGVGAPVTMNFGSQTLTVQISK